MVENNASTDESSTSTGIPQYVKLQHPDITSDADSESTIHTDYIEAGAFTVKRFNFLVAGGSGSGKTTFSTACMQRYFSDFTMKPHDGSPTFHIEELGRCEKMQGTTRVIVTFIDTPGLGDSFHNEDRIRPVIEYIEEQNKAYEKKELFRRPNHQKDDSRIHACFYFFLPHRVTEVDLAFLDILQDRVPLIPLVAKTDTLMAMELEQQLYNIDKALKEHNIEIFDFKESNIDSSWLEGFSAEERQPAGGVPTAAVERKQIPNVFAIITGKREYAWGIASEDSDEHSDTPRLHDVLFKNRKLQSLGRLQERANEIHESCRDCWLAAVRAQQAQEEERSRAQREHAAMNNKQSWSFRDVGLDEWTVFAFLAHVFVSLIALVGMKYAIDAFLVELGAEVSRSHYSFRPRW